LYVKFIKAGYKRNFNPKGNENDREKGLERKGILYIYYICLLLYPFKGSMQI